MRYKRVLSNIILFKDEKNAQYSIDSLLNKILDISKEYNLMKRRKEYSVLYRFSFIWDIRWYKCSVLCRLSSIWDRVYPLFLQDRKGGQRCVSSNLLRVLRDRRGSGSGSFILLLSPLFARPQVIAFLITSDSLLSSSEWIIILFSAITIAFSSSLCFKSAIFVLWTFKLQFQLQNSSFDHYINDNPTISDRTFASSTPTTSQSR